MKIYHEHTYTLSQQPHKAADVDCRVATNCTTYVVRSSIKPCIATRSRKGRGIDRPSRRKCMVRVAVVVVVMGGGAEQVA